MAEETQDVQQQAQTESLKKVDVPTSVSIGQALGYDPKEYTNRTDKHADLLKRFGVSTYAAFEEQLGTPLARSVIAYLLGDADHAKVLGSVLISDAQPPVPGGVKGKPSGSSDSTTYMAGKQTVTVDEGAYFVGDYKFVEKHKADLYAKSLDNPTTADAGESIPKPHDGGEKTALGADAEVGVAEPASQAQKDKDASGITEQQEKQDAAE